MTQGLVITKFERPCPPLEGGIVGGFKQFLGRSLQAILNQNQPPSQNPIALRVIDAERRLIRGL
ncbi:MAG: hypothetical protein DRJ65_18745 [Acidobacteria bacterium]|nr:MAG: hypothetical protein DRJ65_18745 [Acidobacteriota bacterium]